MKRPRPDHRGVALAGICLGTAIALGVGSIPLFDRGGPSLDSDWLRGLGLVAILLVPVSLALVGLHRPPALLAAGVVSFPMCLMSFSFILFPLAIPAVLYLVAYDRAKETYRPRAPAPLVALMTLTFAALAFFSLFINEDPRCYEIVRRSDGSTIERTLPPDHSIYSGSMSVGGGGRVVGSGCSSDSVTPIEVGLSLGLVMLAGTAATYLSGPRHSSLTSLDVYA